MKNIPVFDYSQQYKELEADILTAIQSVLKSGQLILGEQVQTFERGFANFLGEYEHSVAVNSGTDALAISLMALGVGLGDEVITVSNTAVPTISAIRMTGATPVFCDVNEHTALIDTKELPQCITKKTKAIIPVHLFGNAVDISKIRKIINNESIFIIEDCAQAHGAYFNNKMVGTMGDAAAFSFYPTKNLGAYGDGGICFSKNLETIEEMRKIRMYGFSKASYSEREGINSRMDEIQAAILNVKLPYLHSYINKRRQLANLYNTLLKPDIQRVTLNNNAKHAYHLYVIRVKNRATVQTNMLNAGINSGVHYPFPVHLMKGYEFLAYRKGSLPKTEVLAKEVLSLPLYPELDKSSVHTVCDHLNQHLNV